MAESLLNCEVTDRARMAYTTLGEDDRLHLDAWFEQLRNWRNDEVLRERSKRVEVDSETYRVQVSPDLFVVFRIDGDQLRILAILGIDTIRAFQSVAERRAS